jgi:hypothetical protein
MTEAAGVHAGRRELYVRHALLDGRSVAKLRIVDAGDHCVVEADVWAHGSHPYTPDEADPYTFPSVVEATRFVTHTVEALMALGCEVRAE